MVKTKYKKGIKQGKESIELFENGYKVKNKYQSNKLVKSDTIKRRFRSYFIFRKKVFLDYQTTHPFPREKRVKNASFEYDIKWFSLYSCNKKNSLLFNKLERKYGKEALRDSQNIYTK